jgi:hypothetical protein
MSNVLTLNQPQVNTGLVTCICTIPATVAGGYVAGGIFNAQLQVSVPQALPTGTSAGSGAGLGAGAGGGGEGFTGGDLGTGHGGVGQGFGAGNSYQQPPANVTTNAQGPSVTSALSVTVVNTTQSITYYTSTTPTPFQDYLKFKTTFQPAIGDVITITLSSANASDKTLNGVISTITVAQGFN